MSTVKILLDEGESAEEAEELLFKALSVKRGVKHDPQESWDDPAMQDVENVMLDIYAKQYDLMIKEVIEALENEYVGEYGI